MKRIDLPIDEHLPALTELIANENLVLVAASPGSGKTTRLPPALLHRLPGKILVLEPRRIAAVTASHRIAQEEGVAVGDLVGYQIRFEDRTSKATRLLFLTEALLQRKLLDDPGLEGVDAVILDEFHERSVHTETALALLLELQENFRPDLRIVIMSATLGLDELERALPRAKRFEVVAPPHPLEVRRDHRGMLLRPGPDWYDRLVEKVREGLNDSPGGKDVLVFLPGAREIQNLAERLRERNVDARVVPLHAQLPVAEQLKALTPVPGARRVILATNVAESALTLDGVDTVVDSGLERVQQLHHRTGFPSLDLVRISHASAVQRAGRAARQGPGLALRLWSVHDERAMPVERPPELHRIDLSELTLTLAGLRVPEPAKMPWIDPPPPERWRRARAFLRELELLDDDGRLTALGERVNRWPLHPRWGKLLAVAIDRGAGRLGARVAALLQSWGQEGRRFHDLELGLHQYGGGRDPRFSWSRRTEEQLLRLLPRGAQDHEDHPLLEEMVYAAFPDRLARRRPQQEQLAVMVGARGLKLPPGPWAATGLDVFLALELIEGLADNDTQCSLLFKLSPAFVNRALLPRAEKVRTVEWNEKAQAFEVSAGPRLRGLWLSEPHRETARPEDVADALVDVALGRWDEIAARNASVQEWFARYRFYRTRKGGDPDPTPEQRREILTWATQGEKSLTPLFTKDLAPVLASVLLAGEARDFDRACPATLVTPRGRHVRIQYPEPGAHVAPLVEVRIQDAFGWPESPKICGVPLVVDLLAPNGRPAQRTQDLKGFWSSSYKDVRKDLRARYPKHAWPEDPMAPDAVLDPKRKK